MRGVLLASETNHASRRTIVLVHILIPLGFFALVMLLGRFANPFQYDPDEGINLMKAQLLARGHPLYREIWSDQPPIDTLIRAAVFEVTGPSVGAARIVTALFATLMVWALLDLVTRLHSLRAGVAAAILIIASAQFLRLSYSVMIGLPALALTVLSLNLLSRWTMRWNVPALVGSGPLMALGIGTKLFAATAIPAAVAMIWLIAGSDDRTMSRTTRFAATLYWLVMTMLSCAAIYGIFRPPTDQLIGPHVEASSGRTWGATPMALTLMRRDADLVVLSIALTITLLVIAMNAKARGSFAAAGRANLALLVPLIWLICGVIAVQFNRPGRYHHSLLLIIPAAWLGGVAVDALLDARRHNGGIARFGLTAVLVVLLVWQGVKLVVSANRLFGAESRRDERRLVRTMQDHAGETRWVVTDQQIYPFAAGLISPPPLAVISTKRRNTGALSDEYVLEVLERYQPEQVLFAWRIDFGPAVMKYVEEHYRLAGTYKIGAPQPARLYFRGKDLPPTTTPTTTSPERLHRTRRRRH